MRIPSQVQRRPKANTLRYWRYSVRLTLCLFFASSLLCSQVAFAQTSQARTPQPTNQELWKRLTARSPWVFLGDSNTYSGGYVAILDAWMQDSENPKLLNLGVSSETASGLSEVDHPFKRPCVHERLNELLARVEPGVVFICYGMNDGIYQPPRAENMQAYKKGMMRLAAAVHQSGAELVCITPPIFEPEPVKKRDRIGPSENGRYAWFAPAADYDRVLEEQTQWCMTNQIRAATVIDIRSMLHQSKKTLRETDPSFNFSKDGVHFGAVAHGLIAEKILAELGAPAELRANYPQKAAIDAATEKNKILRDAYLSALGKNRPGLPAGLPIWVAEQKAKSIEERSQ